METSKNNPVSNITCGYCSSKITNRRYKCLQCDNWDLCRHCQDDELHADSKHVLLLQINPEKCDKAKLIAFQQMGVLKCKVKLLVDGKLSVIRRFYFDDCTNLSNFRIKCSTLFGFPSNSFKITWTDKEGDDITISKDDEYVCAIHDLSNQIITVHHNKQFVIDLNKNNGNLEQIDQLSICFSLHKK